MPCGSGSYVSYLSADGADVSIVIESMWKNGSVAGESFSLPFLDLSLPFLDLSLPFLDLFTAVS